MDLTELINVFGETKTTADALKKECDEYSKDIKDRMSKNMSYEVSTDKFTAKLSNIETKSFDEPKLLMKLKSMGDIAKSVIRTVEVVDMTALENAIYNREIDASALTDCQIVKTQQRLTVTKIKNKKGE